MEHLKEKIRLVTYDPEEDLEKWAKNLVVDLENAYSEVAERANWLLNRVANDTFELVKPGNLIDANGNVKLVVDSSGDILIQYKSGGTWTDSGWKLKLS